VEDPLEEQRRWRLRRAVNRAAGRIPTGAAEVEWAIEEPPQDQQAPGSHAKSVVAATLEYRRTTHPDGHTSGPREPQYPDVRGRRVRGKVAAADGRLDLAGGTPGGDGGDGGAPNLRGVWSPGEPAADRSNKRPEAKVGEDDVGAGESAMARDRGARVARRDRGGTGGERGPHPGRQAQRARMDRGANPSKLQGYYKATAKVQ